MGAGPRFALSFVKGFAIGLFFDRFPYEYHFSVFIGPMVFYIGIGKAYDE